MRHYGGRWTRLVAATLVAGGLGTFAWAAAASAAGKTGTITVTPDTGLANGQSVTIAGSGFTTGSIGNIVYCNNAPNEPTVTLGAPVNAPLPVGCIAPGYGANALVPASTDGTFSKKFTVATGTIGPPCGVTNAVVSTCPTDSAGQDAKADAANYPCPPTPAQQAAGVVCTLTYGNQAGDVSNAVTILFQGESPPPASTTTTATPATTVARTAPPTTAAASTATTVATAASSGSLATTGPGAQLWWTAVGALVALGAGLVLWLVSLGPARRRASHSSG